ncbi:hypothetical protein LTR95_009191 [Oleoguttula sp. CCFEE 5521]
MHATFQQLLTQGFPPRAQYPPPQAQSHAVPSYSQYGIAPSKPSQVTAAELSYWMEQPQTVATQIHQGIPIVPSSYRGTPQESVNMLQYQPVAGTVRQQSRSEYPCDYQALQQLQAYAGSNTRMPIALTPHSHHAELHPLSFHVPAKPASTQQPYPQQSFEAVRPQTHHHHRLPTLRAPVKSQRTGEALPETDQPCPPSIVGQESMPAPVPNPKDTKVKYTAEDDALLVELKKTKNFAWKQISNLFPGRSSGTLQVRYCTKLKAKTMAWTDDMVSEDAVPYAAETEAGKVT